MPLRIRRSAADRAGRLRAAALGLGFAAVAAPSLAAPEAQPPQADEPNTVSELVVSGARREQPGAVVGDIRPELQLSPAEIQSYGVSSVTELLDELAPQIRSDRGRGGEPPVLLLNGRRISAFNEIRNIPTEAILRVDILPEEAALKYGYAANQRVVNIVLRPFFRAWTAEGAGGGPTAGGQAQGQAEGDLMRIRRDDRLNLDLKLQGQTALTEDERHIVPLTPGEDGRFRTLLPSSRQADANTVLSHGFGRISATFNASLGATHTEALSGLPPGAPASGADPLRQTTDGWTGHLGATFNGDRGKWRFNLTGAYDHSDSLTHSEVGLSAAGLSGLFSGAPAGATALAGTVGDRIFDKARARSDGLNVHLLAAGPALQLPAGPVLTSLRVGDTASGFDSSSLRSGLAQSISLSRNDLSAQGNLDLPLASRRNGVIAAAGELHVNGNAAVDRLSDFGTLTTLGYGLNWQPVTGLTLIASHTRDEAAPSFQQLGDPTVITPGARVFDFVTGRTVEVRAVGGGNPALRSDTRNVGKLGLTWKPIEDQDLTFTANYVESRIDNPIETFPAVTAQIQAAFPDRFVRDAAGNLVQVDYRPVNYAAERKSELRWGVNYSRPLGPQPQFARRGGGPVRVGGLPDGGPDGDGPPRGGPGGGPRFAGGGFGGPFGGRAPPGRLQFAIYHTVIFEDRMLVRPGGPTFDLLHGAAAGSTGGQPRHEVEAQGGVFWHGMAARLSADWKSSTTVTGSPGSSVGDLSFSDIAKVDLRFFADLGLIPGYAAKHPWARGARVSLAFTNLFDARVHVHDATGATPIGYQPDLLDPQGRTIRLSFRKLFFGGLPPPPPGR